MAGTYTQLYVHIVFVVKGRQNLIRVNIKDEVNKYIAGIIEGKSQKSIIVNGMPDHIHVLAGIKPTMNVSDLARDIKNNSSRFINEKRWVSGKFEWQEGYGAFTHSHSELDKVYKYILNQEKHHDIFNFKREYLALLKKYNIEYNEKYLFDWLEE